MLFLRELSIVVGLGGLTCYLFKSAFVYYLYGVISRQAYAFCRHKYHEGKNVSSLLTIVRTWDLGLRTWDIRLET